MKFLTQLAAWIDKLNERVGNSVIWLTSALVLIVCYDVITRYLFRESMVAIQELEWHLFAFIFLLAAAFTLKHDRHVRVDVFYVKFSPKVRAWVDLFGTLFFLIPFSLVVIISSWNFVAISFKIGETSPDPGGLPARYILKAAIPIAFILVLLQSISIIHQSLKTILNPTAEEGESES
ncbi:MAG: TRAP transporter small permease subunit [Calditrichaeota bacterium]|nr:MAG: TRAP transporter small permease subunit [Calditrichota bacterium]